MNAKLVIIKTEGPLANEERKALEAKFSQVYYTLIILDFPCTVWIDEHAKMDEVR